MKEYILKYTLICDGPILQFLHLIKNTYTLEQSGFVTSAMYISYYNY